MSPTNIATLVNMMEKIKVLLEGWLRTSPVEEHPYLSSQGHITHEPRGRAQKKVSKGRPNTPPQSCGVVIDPQV